MLLLGLGIARAQQVAQYEQDELDPKAKDFKRLLNAKDNEIVAMLLGSSGLELGKFETYFKKDVFPHFTQINYAVANVVVDTKTKRRQPRHCSPKSVPSFASFILIPSGSLMPMKQAKRANS